MLMKLDQDEPKTEMNRLSQPVSMKDGLRAEYDLKRMRVRKVGPLRSKFGDQVLRFAFDDVEDTQCGNRE